MSETLTKDPTSEYLSQNHIKPSTLVRAMVDGLEGVHLSEGFGVDMDSWLRRDSKTCFGCAATCALWKITGKNPVECGLPSWQTSSNASRAAFFELDAVVLTDVEVAVDAFRRGSHEILEDLFYLDLPRPAIELPQLSTGNWWVYLDAYRAYADQLEEVGL